MDKQFEEKILLSNVPVSINKIKIAESRTRITHMKCIKNGCLFKEL